MARRCDWFIERCAEIIEEEKLIEFVGRVAAGKESDYRMFEGSAIKTPAALNDRLMAFKMLAEWGIGKPIQVVITNPNITPNDSVRSAQQIFEMIKKLEDNSKELVPAGDGNGRH